MSLSAVLVWMFVGLVAGWLASKVAGGGFGLIGDIVIGIVGSFLGGTIFRTLNIHSPIGGMPGTILVAFVGAVVLLGAIRLVRSLGTRHP